MNIGFLEIIVDNGDISFIRSKFCYNFRNNNSNESIVMKEDYSTEPFMKDYIDKFLYKFLYYFKDMDCIIGLDIDEGIKILLERINKAINNDRYSFVFHNSFKIIDLKYKKNCDLFFSLAGLSGDILKEYPYQTSLLNKSEFLSSIFESIGGVFNAKLYNDTLFSSKGTILINPEKIIIEEKPKINNHFTLLKDDYKAEGRILDLNLGNDSRFVLSKGSFGNINASYKKDKKLRDAFLKYGKIEYGSYFMNILEDIQFQSPKLAADFLFGNSKGKNEYRIDDEGNSIDINNYAKYTDSIESEIATTNNEINTNIQENNDIPDFNDPLDAVENSNYTDSELIIPNHVDVDKSKWIPEEMEELTEEQASYFVNSGLDRLCFNKLKLISSGIAKILATFKGSYLGFPSLEEISTGQVCILCRGFKGKELDLSSITKIYEYLSYYLALFEGDILNLSGLTSVTKDLKLLLANSKCKTIILKGIKYLTVDEFEELKSSDLEVVLSGDIYTKFSNNSIKNLKVKCVRGIPHTSFTWESARHLASFNGDVLEVGIDSGAFRYDSLRELIKFKGDYLIVSGFDELEEDQEKILVQFGGTKLGVHGKLTFKQKEFLNGYSGKTITYSDDEKRVLEEELQYSDVDKFESDGGFDEDDVFDFNSKGVLREEEEDGYLKIIGDHLTNERAERYSKFDGKTLELELKHINNTQVKLLSHFKGKTLIISGIESISDDQAKNLSHFQGRILELSSIKRLSNKQQAYLNHFNGDKLELTSLYQ